MTNEEKLKARDAFKALPKLQRDIVTAIIKCGLPKPAESCPSTPEEIADAIGAPVAGVRLACHELHEKHYLTAFTNVRAGGLGCARLEYGLPPDSPVYGVEAEASEAST